MVCQIFDNYACYFNLISMCWLAYKKILTPLNGQVLVFIHAYRVHVEMLSLQINFVTSLENKKLQSKQDKRQNINSQVFPVL